MLLPDPSINVRVANRGLLQSAQQAMIALVLYAAMQLLPRLKGSQVRPAQMRTARRFR